MVWRTSPPRPTLGRATTSGRARTRSASASTSRDAAPRGQALGHRPDHVAALEGRARRRESLGPDEVTERARSTSAPLGGAQRSAPEQVVERAALGRPHVEAELGGLGEPALPQSGARHRRAEVLGRAGDQGGHFGRAGECAAGGRHEALDLAPAGREGSQHRLGHPLELGHAAGRPGRSGRRGPSPSPARRAAW